MSPPETAVRGPATTGRFAREVEQQAPEERRAAEERERRHRERAIADWLRSLVREDA